MTSEFSISGVDHIGITVRDMDASVRFYRDLLGLHMVCDVEVSHRPGRAPGIYSSSHSRRRFALFATGSGPNLALNGHPGDELPGEPIPADGVGINHVSLVVSDLAALTERLVAAGIESPGPGWFVDPDGTLVQFEEPGYSKAALPALVARAEAASNVKETGS
jgi:catechol 2,3-dioxygenase-like lactoylglutathione lyase family enzyme